ncbi:MAG: methyl-accepting chemotaxis protein, partial [Rhodospirillaceae bacterium]|nr:methyl-accepting chemotaxis protein [Rhodospirillaceae bacterium]
MDKLSSHWTNPANVKKWTDFKVVLDEFKIAQQQVEDIANGPDQFPANVILLNEAAPLAGKMLGAITAMIDEEGSNPQGGDEYSRKRLLGMMADVRGTFAVGLANIRAYLLSGDEKFRGNFDKLWAKNTKRFGDLTDAANMLTPAQAEQFALFYELREKFAPLPPRMFEIGGSKKWNMANYTLVTEAAPRAGKLLTTLSGEKDEAGQRSGGMVANQKRLLNEDADLLADEMNNLVILQWVLLAAGLVIGIAVGFATIRAIVGPITSMTGAMGELAGGNKGTEIPGTERKDEIGEMAGAVQVFKENMIKNDEMAEAQRKEDEIKHQRGEKIEKLTSDFDNTVSNSLGAVASASTELNATSETMAASSEETTRQATAVAAAAEEASTNVQTVASASEELSSSIDEIRRQVSQSTDIAGKAVDEAKRTDSTVRSLSEAAGKIGDVVALITDIAEQTNLLALNATIEAARAGDAGKGFAVVANEVKSLANQTAKATDEIGGQIKGMQVVTEEAVSAIEGISSIIDEISTISTSIASAVEEQSAATTEISRNVQQAA